MGEVQEPGVTAMRKWFEVGWYRYPIGGKNWTNLWRRVRGHPGVWWYADANAREPDVHRKRCDEGPG